jgi:hypothetical protein
LAPSIQNDLPAAAVVSDETRATYSSTANGPRWEVIAIVLAILLFAAIRWRLRDVPLERDEGEYAYAGQLMLQGIPPYQIAYNMKLPGTYAAYAGIMSVFGQTTAGIHLGLLVVNLVSILLLYGLGKRLYGPRVGAIAGVTYGLLSVGPWVQGFAAHATHFVVVTAIAGLLLLFDATRDGREWKLFIAGLCLGLAFVMKQPGGAFGVFAVLYLAMSSSWRKTEIRASLRRLFLLNLGMVLPFALTCLLLWRAGVFRRFWFWTFTYAYQYATNVGAKEGWGYFVKYFSQAAGSAIALWGLAGIGLTTFVWSRKARLHAVFMLGLLLFSGVAFSAGLYFRPHYFILLLPALSLLVGLAIESAIDFSSRGTNRFFHYFPVAILVVAVIATFAQEFHFYFEADPVSASRYVYPKDPFPESVAIGRYIEKNFPPLASMAVLGSEPQIMFYSRHRSVTGYLYTYSLTEEQKYANTMQRDLISQIEAARPDFLVYIQDWLIRPGSDRTIFPWFRRYVVTKYRLVGIMRVRDGLQLRSENEILQAPGNLEAAIFLYQRTSF